MSCCRVEYRIVINRNPTDPILTLPDLPPNARYILHDNVCLDFGTIEWMLTQGKVEITKYKYFVILNSSVRGPYVPRFARLLRSHVGAHQAWHWTDAFTRTLTNVNKLVGSTISCEQGFTSKGTRTAKGYHVQSQVYATDIDGLQFLLSGQDVFKCYGTYTDFVARSEIGMSKLIQEAGFTSQSLMTAYIGYDWQLQQNWNCNNRANPNEAGFMGVLMKPFEVMFVKVKHRQRHLSLVQWAVSSWDRSKALGMVQPTIQGNPTGQDVPHIQSVWRASATAPASDEGSASESVYNGSPQSLVIFSLVAANHDGLSLANLDYFLAFGSMEPSEASFVILITTRPGTHLRFKVPEEGKFGAHVKFVLREATAQEDNPLQWALNEILPLHLDKNKIVFIDGKVSVACL